MQFIRSSVGTEGAGLAEARTAAKAAVIESDMSPLRALFVGDGSLLVRCAEIYVQTGNSIVGVVTSNGAVADWARRADIPVFDWPAGSKPDIGSVRFDYLFSIANLGVIPQEILARASRCAVNFHNSMLPAYAGLNATSWAIIAGERVMESAGTR